MKEWIDEHLGYLLFGLALVWTLLAMVCNRATLATFPDEAKVTEERAVQVPLDLAELASARNELFFPPKTAQEYIGGTRCVFVEEIRKIEFVPVELAIPPAFVMRPPQLLPDPGPSLEGADALPRWGDELPPVPIDLEDPKKVIK